ncbi:hypothetical protein B0A55_03165 [Friedmanniomyces simplex]|uniref:Large ribosomal subunit protein bL33m n=1 Tax=Friedmanniomyces simplex TaxID=329884 RepID=A0A4U0XR66_9PEZI|nr:hypothetical protein B0A55_03165 [Friedmanniomyces simplex]
MHSNVVISSTVPRPWRRSVTYPILPTKRRYELTLPPAKSRTIAVRLISMAMTGYYKTFSRPRTHRPLSMLKYDPVVKKKVLFLEQKRGGGK